VTDSPLGKASLSLSFSLSLSLALSMPANTPEQGKKAEEEEKKNPTLTN
jgi:hypothetical protein